SERAQQSAPPRAPGRGKKLVRATPPPTPPQEIVGGNQRRQQDEAQPSVARMVPDVGSSCQRIDQDLHAVLRPHRAADRGDDGGNDGGMGKRPPPYVTGEERGGTIAVPTSILHCGRNSPSRRRRTRY